MKKSISLLVFTHLIAVFMGMFLFCIANKISENNIETWYNGTIDLSRYNKAPEIRMIPHEYKGLYVIYLYPSDYIDKEGYLTEETYNKIQYENFGIYSTPNEAQEAYIKLNNYFQKRIP